VMPSRSEGWGGLFKVPRSGSFKCGIRANCYNSPVFSRIVFVLFVSSSLVARGARQAPQTPATPTRAEILRGEYDRYRANNDLLYYHLDIRVDPDKKFISGKNTIRFRMLKDDTRIQLDLVQNLKVDKILLDRTPLHYDRELNTVFVDFPETLKTGKTYSIDFHYSGTPQETGRFGGFTFKKDASGHPWINSSCEGPGAMVWWPNKDQWRDEVERMEISVAVPNDLVDVSNGKFIGKTALGDGYTRWDWLVQYPINNYDVSVNIGNYAHFTDRYRDMTLDFYCPKISRKHRSSSCRPDPCWKHSRNISASILSRRTATSLSKRRTPEWNIRPL
jgi:hypothetical protein